MRGIPNSSPSSHTHTFTDSRISGSSGWVANTNSRSSVMPPVRSVVIAVPRSAPGQRTVRKKVRTSSTKRSGCSIAAKWPPRGISAQCVTL